MTKQRMDFIGMLYDPPEGWKYGFPKRYNPLVGETIKETLKRDGYPQHLIDQGLWQYTRFIDYPETEDRPKDRPNTLLDN